VAREAWVEGGDVDVVGVGQDVLGEIERIAGEVVFDPAAGGGSAGEATEGLLVPTVGDVSVEEG
jgi:hypothetical protein